MSGTNASLASEIYHPRPASPSPSSQLQPPVSHAERVWHETQHKLDEVEAAATSPTRPGPHQSLSAIASPTMLPGTYIFGPAHTEAIEALRAAQSHLAQAWMRSEDDAEREELDAQHEGLGGGEGMGKGAEDHGDWEGGVDLRLARKRRDANERHFRKVRELVLDVGGRLDGVAEAMRKVENESRGVWEENNGSSSSIDRNH